MRRTNHIHLGCLGRLMHDPKNKKIFCDRCGKTLTHGQKPVSETDDDFISALMVAERLISPLLEPEAPETASYEGGGGSFGGAGASGDFGDTGSSSDSSDSGSSDSGSSDS